MPVIDTGGSKSGVGAHWTLDVTAKVAAIFPLVHLLACSIYLAGYIRGFAGNLSSLFQVSDLFSLSFSGITRIYLMGILLPAAVFKWVEPNIRASIERRNHEEVVEVPRDIKRALLLLLILSAIELITRTFSGSRPTFEPVFSWLPLLFGIYLWFYPRFRDLRVLHALIIINFVVICLTAGYDKGDEDRRRPFDQLKSGHFACYDFIVLRRVGDRFIAVRRDSRRIVIDGQCVTRFEFPTTPLIWD